MKKDLINSTYFAGEINLLLCYSIIVQSILICIVGLLCIIDTAFIFVFLENIILSLIIASFLGFASGSTYLLLASIKKITIGRNSPNNPVSKTQLENNQLYASRFKVISLILFPTFLLLLSVFIYRAQLPIHQFINEHIEGFLIGSSSILLLAITSTIAYRRSKSMLHWSRQEPATEEALVLKIKTDHQACIIGQIIYLPFFLLFILVVTEVS